MFVMIVNEGDGLENMVNGFIRRYFLVGVLFFEVFYVDRDCCVVKIKEFFLFWDNLLI